MARIKGSGVMGPVRSLRLPQALEGWFERRLMEFPERSSSELLVTLLHGGLRLQDGYMRKHFKHLATLIDSGSAAAYAVYLACLSDTFGAEYTAHIESWLEAEGFRPPMLAITSG